MISVVSLPAERPAIRPGDVVRRRDRKHSIGVVLAVMDESEVQDGTGWYLYVDAAYRGRADGVGVWSPAETIVANDDSSVAEARSIGLRGIDPSD
jgi:hypothetical protein